MNVLATEYSPYTKSFDIFLAGCAAPHCPGCFNPESWDFDQGDACNKGFLQKILTKIHEFDLLIDNVMVMGGEPLDHEETELLELLWELKKQTRKAMWMFTKYEFDQIPEPVKEVCDYIKCGRYDQTQPAVENVQYGVSLASANQRIYHHGTDYVCGVME